MKVAVIGGGPAGYSCALHLSRKGFEVTVFEREQVGGVCLNRGCVPTKHLIAYARTVRKAKEMGMEVHSYSVRKAVGYASSGATFFRESVEKILKKTGVRLIKAEAVVRPDRTVEFDSEREVFAAVVIATGSKPFIPEGLRSLPVLSGEDFSSFEDWKRVAVVGAGAQGIEIASFFNLMGAEVFLLEVLDRILASLPARFSQAYEARLKKNGMKVLKGRTISSVEHESGRYAIRLTDGTLLEGIDQIIVTAGRLPNTDSVKVENIKDEKGFIKVNQFFQTEVEGIYACGDCIKTPALAYAAYAEAEAVAENIAGKSVTVNYENLPFVVFGSPEIAWAGRLEGNEVRVQSGVSAKAYAELERDGFAALFAEGGDLKGGILVGAEASEAIHLVQMLMIKGIPENLFFVHPSFSEIVGEALLKMQGRERHA